MATNVGGTERIVRAVLGAGLVLVGLLSRRGRPVRAGAVLAGIELLYTARTQYCPANAAVGRDTSADGRDLAELPA